MQADKKGGGSAHKLDIDTMSHASHPVHAEMLGVVGGTNMKLGALRTLVKTEIPNPAAHPRAPTLCTRSAVHCDPGPSLHFTSNSGFRVLNPKP